ncbi:MAG: hypothetical protein JXB08_06370 [Bacilli bacterium]|nr:hypothetical protein [Bacilli bacterium]MBN2876591.1 hypothetical protein [Bacilli bacterium]
MKRSLVFLLIAVLGVMLISCTEQTTTKHNTGNAIYSDELEVDYPFPNPLMYYVYHEYKDFYSGYYYEDGTYILQVKTGGPQELQEYLEETNYEYGLVPFSYSEMISVMNYIVAHMEGSNISMCGINITENYVEVMLRDPDIPDFLNGFVLIGIVEISDHFGYSTLNYM